MAITTSYYTGKKELTMAQYEALPTLDNNKDYSIVDFPDNGMTYEQLAYALTCNRLFNAGFITVCISTGGIYTEKTIYKMIENGGTKSWESLGTIDSYTKAQLDLMISGINQDIIIPANSWVLGSEDASLWAGTRYVTDHITDLYYANYSEILDSVAYPLSTFYVNVNGTRYNAVSETVSSVERRLSFIGATYENSFNIILTNNALSALNNTGLEALVTGIYTTVGSANYIYNYSNNLIHATSKINIKLDDSSRTDARNINLWDFAEQSEGQLTFRCILLPTESLYLNIDGTNTPNIHTRAQISGLETVSYVELDVNLKATIDGKANIESPEFTGAPTSPSAALSDNSDKIATTAWVKSQGYSTGSSNIDSVQAGVGLTGGGDTGDVNIAMAPPATLTLSTTNSAYEGGHTHELSIPAATTNTAGLTAIDNALSNSSTNPVQNIIVNEALNSKQKTLTAGSNINLDANGNISAVDTTYGDATTSTAGLMSAADKTKLNGIAAGAQVNVQPDWDATVGTAVILNKPALATVATSGSYNDLSNTPTIPAAQVNADWDATEGVAAILNKPAVHSVLNARSTSQSDSYSANYVNNNFVALPLAQKQFITVDNTQTQPIVESALETTKPTANANNYMFAPNTTNTNISWDGTDKFTCIRTTSTALELTKASSWTFIIALAFSRNCSCTLGSRALYSLDNGVTYSALCSNLTFGNRTYNGAADYSVVSEATCIGTCDELNSVLSLPAGSLIKFEFFKSQLDVTPLSTRLLCGCEINGITYYSTADYNLASITVDTNLIQDGAVTFAKLDADLQDQVEDGLKYSQQNLTTAQQLQSRTNIGAGTSSFSGSYTDLSNTPTIPTVGAGEITFTQQGVNKGTFSVNQSNNATIALGDNNTTYTIGVNANTVTLTPEKDGVQESVQTITVPYATNADKANKLSNTADVGSSTNPVYFNANGTPSAITYSLNKTVPSDAVFTDTVTTIDGVSGAITNVARKNINNNFTADQSITGTLNVTGDISENGSTLDTTYAKLAGGNTVTGEQVFSTTYGTTVNTVTINDDSNTLLKAVGSDNAQNQLTIGKGFMEVREPHEAQYRFARINPSNIYYGSAELGYNTTLNLPTLTGAVVNETIATQEYVTDYVDDQGFAYSTDVAEDFNTHNTSEQAHSYIRGLVSTAQTKANEAYSLAEGREKAVSYDTLQTTANTIKAVTNGTTFKIGDNIFIQELEVPDLWIRGINATQVAYTWVDNTTFVDTINTVGYVDLGYYRVSKLETSKVDLSGYVVTSRTVNGHALTADVMITQGDVGLGNVTNTSDADKPISTAQQAALDLKANLAGGNTIEGQQIFEAAFGSTTNRLYVNETEYDVFTVKDTTSPTKKTAISKGYIWTQYSDNIYSQFKPTGIYFGNDDAGFEGTLAFPTTITGGAIKTIATVDNIPTTTSQLTNNSNFVSAVTGSNGITITREEGSENVNVSLTMTSAQYEKLIALIDSINTVDTNTVTFNKSVKANDFDTNA